MELTAKQEFGIKLTKQWWENEKIKRPFILTGIAGSGKTTLINKIIEELEVNEDEVAFVCFTGKAASILNKKGLPATTIHRLIYNPELNEETNELKFNLKESLSEKLKLIIIDEISMVSQDIMRDILSFKIPIIGCGDPFQLQPVSGEVNDLINHPDIFLDEPLRQSLDSPIVYLANKVRKKQKINLGNYQDLVQIISKNNIPLDYFVRSDQILAGKNITVTNLNKYYRRVIMNIESDSPVIGDKLLCLKNNYDIEIEESGISQPLVNGLTGYLREVIETDHKLQTYSINLRPDYFENNYYKNIKIDKIYFDKNIKDDNYIFQNMEIYKDIIKERKKYEKLFGNKINKFTYGYCITVHKAQGSQWEKVFLINEYLNRDTYYNWLYTGITRAEKELIIAL